MGIGAMIVDDDADIRFLIRTTIEMANGGLFVAGEAENGMQAIDRLDMSNPQVVVIDAMMPELNGIETALKIRELRPNLPMIMCTAFFSEDLRAKATEAGIKVFLSKTEVQQIPAKMIELAGNAPLGSVGASGFEPPTSAV